MKTLFTSIAALALAAAAGSASAENAVGQSQERLRAALAAEADDAPQVTSSARPTAFGSLFGAEIGFGIGGTGRVDNGEFGNAYGGSYGLTGRHGVDR
ncbi:hypothetical protein LNKW23_08640 [Paralimibaculum aggregatum]|uniref:Uncharacterized protein n=1 Tax=Paralimibaculum aggregatum TaxID=3036245 RepID=A0ABQ6LMI1_9RHOB|nr:hypothetical protein [Limibaculum sp. NKW23]GMG81651.1 hypothetical protein LNKW23_08640 [Limibaculum sp. NKW23]